MFSNPMAKVMALISMTYGRLVEKIQRMAAKL
jgi:hypothetical protein